MTRPVTLFSGQWVDLPSTDLVEKTREFGYDGIELACWTDHFEVDKALAEDDYCDNKRKALDDAGLQCHAISAHRVGQAVLDRIDERHQAILPEYVWGDGNTDGVNARAIEELKNTARAAQKFGVEIVNGFTGSSIWHLLYSFPPVPQSMTIAGFDLLAERFNPILDVFGECRVRFALEVHPTEIAFDIHTAERALHVLNRRPEFGFSFDPSHLIWQGIDPVKFLRRFPDRIYHVQINDAIVTLDGESGINCSHLNFSDVRRGWSFRGPGRGGVNFEEIIRALNDIGYNGPLSVECEDSGMKRSIGAREALEFTRKLDFSPSTISFDAAFDEVCADFGFGIDALDEGVDGVGSQRTSDESIPPHPEDSPASFRSSHSERLSTSRREESFRSDAAPSTSGINENLRGLTPASFRGMFDEQSDEQREEVDCTIFAPPSAGTGEAALVQVFIHSPLHEGDVLKTATKVDSRACWRGSTSLGTELARGSQLSFQLTIPRFQYEAPEQSIVWRGRTASVQFSVEIPCGAKAGDAHGTIYVAQDSIPIGQITFILVVETACPTPSGNHATGKATRFSQAFVSYARSDTPDVTKRVKLLEAVGIRYFQDVFSLKPGEQWLPRIYKAIDDSDVLLLFWSRAARASSWVEKEWRYGLETNGDGFIVPVAIEGPPIPEPPSELQQLHFGGTGIGYPPMPIWKRFSRWFQS